MIFSENFLRAVKGSIEQENHEFYVSDLVYCLYQTWFGSNVEKALSDEEIIAQAQATATIAEYNSVMPLSNYVAKFGAVTKNDPEPISTNGEYTDFIVLKRNERLTLPLVNSLTNKTCLFSKKDKTGDFVFNTVEKRLCGIKGIDLRISRDVLVDGGVSVEKSRAFFKKNHLIKIQIDKNLSSNDQAVALVYAFFRDVRDPVTGATEPAKHARALLSTMLFLRTVKFDSRQTQFNIEKALELQFVNTYLSLDQKQRNFVIKGIDDFDKVAIRLGYTHNTYSAIIEAYGDSDKISQEIGAFYRFEKDFYRKLCGTTELLKDIDMAILESTKPTLVAELTGKVDDENTEDPVDDESTDMLDLVHENTEDSTDALDLDDETTEDPVDDESTDTLDLVHENTEDSTDALDLDDETTEDPVDDESTDMLDLVHENTEDSTDALDLDDETTEDPVVDESTDAQAEDDETTEDPVVDESTDMLDLVHENTKDSTDALDLDDENSEGPVVDESTDAQAEDDEPTEDPVVEDSTDAQAEDDEITEANTKTQKKPEKDKITIKKDKTSYNFKSNRKTIKKNNSIEDLVLSVLVSAVLPSGQLVQMLKGVSGVEIKKSGSSVTITETEGGETTKLTGVEKLKIKVTATGKVDGKTFMEMSFQEFETKEK